MAEEESRDIHHCFHNGPHWVCKKKKKKKKKACYILFKKHLVFRGHPIYYNYIIKGRNCAGCAQDYLR